MKLKGVLNFILDPETADSTENLFCELYACTREKVSGCRLREIKNPASLKVRTCLKNAHRETRLALLGSCVVLEVTQRD